jgi:hypothetical protein
MKKTYLFAILLFLAAGCQKYAAASEFAQAPPTRPTLIK